MSDPARAWAALPQITNIRASADGRWAFCCRAGVTETEEVWAIPASGGPAERLTHGQDHFSIRDVSPDGMRLILAQSRNSNEHDHLFLLDRSAQNRLTQLTPEQSIHYLYGGIFAEGGRSVIYLADFDYDTGSVTAGGWVWKQDLATGARTCLARSESPFDTGIKLSPDRRRLLWHRHDHLPGGTQLWVLNLDGSGLAKVLDLGEANNARGEWIAPDRIAFVADLHRLDKAGILSLHTGDIAWLGGEPDFFPFDVVPGGEDRFALIVHEQSNTRAKLCEGLTLSNIPNLSGRRSLLPHDAFPDGGWLAEAYDADEPHDLVRIHPDGACTTLLRAQPDPARRHPAPPEDFRWSGPDGMPMQGWLYRPEGTPKGLIAYVHGGPTWHSEDWTNPKIGYWVQQGYAVLDSNYRGSTGFGYAHREAVKEDGWGGREQADIRAGIEAALAAGIPGPVAVAGNSYGGFSSWVAITRHADLVTAAIPMCGMYRLDIDYHETEMPHGRAYSEEMMGGTPEEFPEKYANASPGNFIDRIRGHLMIVHGLADSNVGPENTHTAVRELSSAGIPHEVLLFANEGHGIFRRTNVQTYLDRSAAFLDRAFREGKR